MGHDDLGGPVRLSILICHLPSRKDSFKRLRDQLAPQIDRPDVEVLTDNNDGSVGVKRQRLLERATGEFVAYIDDDDRIASDYVERIICALVGRGNADCCSLRGVITTDGIDPRPFVHSITHRVWYEEDGVYYRPPNHLNPIKREHALKVGFPDSSHGEDRVYSEGVLQYLKNEADTGPEPLYFYDYVGGK